MRILVADDSPHLVLLYRAILEDAGYEVVSVSNGMAAIAAVEERQRATRPSSTCSCRA